MSRTNPIHKPKPCAHCGNDFMSFVKASKFCSVDCRINSQRKITADRAATGDVSDRGTLRKYLVRVHGYKCQCCGHSEWQGVRLPLEVDHIDGDASNNLPSNLRLLCPNCHSITPTWKAKNKGNGRQSRGMKSV